MTFILWVSSDSPRVLWFSKISPKSSFFDLFVMPVSFLSSKCNVLKCVSILKIWRRKKLNLDLDHYSYENFIFSFCKVLTLPWNLCYAFLSNRLRFFCLSYTLVCLKSKIYAWFSKACTSKSVEMRKKYFAHFYIFFKSYYIFI